MPEDGRSGAVRIFATLTRYWFLIGLAAVLALTVGDSSRTVSAFGLWIGTRGGPDAVIVLIFLFSGWLLDPHQVRAGLQDTAGTASTLAVIFLASPVVAALLSRIPLETGVLIGLLIVAAMPSTLSSGVVMSGAAGGNMAHALFVTVLANILAVFVIPVSLALLLELGGNPTSVVIDKWGIMFKLGGYVLLPLAGGALIRRVCSSSLLQYQPVAQLLNQLMVLGMVWMGLSQTRDAIIAGGASLLVIVAVAFVFHALLLASAALLARVLRLGRGRRESLFFIGTQKTLPLSIILQVSLFPAYGLALVFCVVHHIVHLMMDGYLVGRLRH
jgi:sodium/bile acid cotransporter 7